jgi:hypothetical protein
MDKQGCPGGHQVSASLSFVCGGGSHGTRSFDVKQDVQDEWNIYGDEILKRTVWSSGCKSWYKNSTGRIFALYPGSILHFKDLIENIRSEDFDITYQNKKVYAANIFPTLSSTDWLC